jgi:hypothetical protein
MFLLIKKWCTTSIAVFLEKTFLYLIQHIILVIVAIKMPRYIIAACIVHQERESLHGVP